MICFCLSMPINSNINILYYNAYSLYIMSKTQNCQVISIYNYINYPKIINYTIPNLKSVSMEY